MRRTSDWLLARLSECIRIFIVLVKTMVPAMFVVRLLELAGATAYLAKAFDPLMGLAGLPGAAAIAWATCIFSGLYASVAVMISLLPEHPMTVAQVSVLCSLLLFAHMLPVEQTIVRRAGPSALVTGFLRIAGGYVFAILLNFTYGFTGTFQQPASPAWMPEISADTGWVEWTYGLGQTLIICFFVILGLLILMRAFDAIGGERIIGFLLRPLLRMLGIGEQAAQIAIIGLLLGITYGGGLIIGESKAGRVGPRDVFLTMVFLGFCHSLIEDTAIMMAAGAEPIGIVLGRLGFSLVATAALSLVIRRMPDRYFYRFLTKAPAASPAPKGPIAEY